MWTLEGRSSSNKASTMYDSKRKEQTNQEFLMEQIKIMTDEEKKKRAISHSYNKNRVQKISSKALIQKKKQYQFLVDPVQLEFNKLKKEVGTDFKKVESVANSIK